MITKLFFKETMWEVEQTFKGKFRYSKGEPAKAYVIFLLSMLLMPMMLSMDIVLLPLELLFIPFKKIMKKSIDKQI